jgi:hypothetical protein
MSCIIESDFYFANTNTSNSENSSDRPRELADADELLTINAAKLDNRNHET